VLEKPVVVLGSGSHYVPASGGAQWPEGFLEVVGLLPILGACALN